MANMALVFDILAKDRASKEFDKVGDAADKAGKKGSKFGKAMAAGAATAGAAIAGFAASSVRAFVESEEASLRLDAALAKFPKTADVSRASFDKLNAALARKTKFDDDATASGQAVLAQFGLTGKQIQELTPLLQDYAAKTGRDLPSAAEVLGKAVMGQGRALKDVGLNLKDTGSATSNLENLMGGLRTQVGGFATQEGQTAAGQAAILRNQFGELQEQVGAKLTPALVTLAEKLLAVIGFVERNSAVIGPLAIGLGALAASVWAVNTAQAAWTATTAAGAAVRSLFVSQTTAATAATGSLTTAQWGLNAAMLANPIGAVVAAIGALVAVYVVAWNKSERFRTSVDQTVGVFRELYKWMKKASDLVSGTWLGDAAQFLSGGRSYTGRRANGGAVMAGQPYLVGERGPEVITPSRNSLVIPNGGLTINGGINVRSGPGETAAVAVPRALRNMAFVHGYA